MKELKSLKSMIVPSVGLSVLAIILLSYWSSTFTLHRLDVKYAGRKTLHLQAFPNSDKIRYHKNFINVSKSLAYNVY